MKLNHYPDQSQPSLMREPQSPLPGDICGEHPAFYLDGLSAENEERIVLRYVAAADWEILELGN